MIILDLLLLLEPWCRHRVSSDFRPSGRKIDSRPGYNQVTWVNSAFHPFGVGESSTGLTGWG